jgi:hypothetical protein
VAAGYAAAQGRAPLRQPQRGAAVGVPAHIGHEPAVTRQLPLSARGPVATEPRPPRKARPRRLAPERGGAMTALLGSPVAAADPRGLPQRDPSRLGQAARSGLID